MIPLFVLPITLLLMVASSTRSDKHFFVIATLYRPPPHQDWGRVGTTGNCFARDDRKLLPQLG
jgi:hypothetical protein